MPKGGSSRAVGVGAELRKLRISHGWTTEQVAEHVPLSRATLNRVELGQRDVSPEEVASILTALGIKDDTYEALIALARGSSSVAWLEAGTAVSQQIASLAAYESAAEVITEVATSLVPGLLQTAGYLRALMPTEQVSDDRVEHLLAVRLSRQTVLSRPKPPKLRVFLDEAILHRPIGSDQVFAEQMEKHVRDSRWKHIEIRLLPFSIGAHAGSNGTYATLEGKRFKIAYIQGQLSSFFLEDQEIVQQILGFNCELDQIALDEEDTRQRLLERIITDEEALRIQEVQRV